MKTPSEYKKLSPIEHILLRQDTYVGSMNKTEEELFTVASYDASDIKIEKKLVRFVPAFLKIFDEIITNASDHSIRTGEVKQIKVVLTKDYISIENDGPSIPISKHTEEKDANGLPIYIPELIFFHLLSGSNFNDNEKRYVGGRNGLGSKLCNIFSNRFILETCDGKQTYTQESGKNLSVINPPIVKRSSAKSYTRITFYPDYARFGMKELDDDMYYLLLKRVLDIAVYCPTVKVIVNEQPIPIKSLKDYMEMHVAPGTEMFHESLSNGWEVGIAHSPTDVFQQVSIVNGITTYRGGTHINKASSELSGELLEQLLKLHKKLNIKAKDVKDKLFMFLICKIPNPTFDTQTKECLTNYISKDIYGDSKFSAPLIKKIMKSDIVESILNLIELKKRQELSQLNKSLQKLKVEKLIDAKGKDRLKCSIRIFEGDSATSAFRKFREPNLMGAFPIRGKFVNVSELSASDIMKNEEVKNLVSAIGLNVGEKYDPTKLRYGSIYISSDADCVEENTLVITDSGEKRIKDITPSDLILTHTNTYQRVVRVVESVKEESITVRVNGNDFTCSINHKLIVVRDGVVTEIIASDLKYTDFFLLKNKK